MTTAHITAAAAALRDRGDATALRVALMQESPTRAEVDAALAQLWREADDGVKSGGLRDALDGLLLGTELVRALLDSVDAAVAGRGTEIAANAALRVLREAGDDPLDGAGWCRIAAVAQALRHEAVPALDAALLLAERGPAAAGPTLALTAFRDGPEDAGDRLAALAALGRYDDPRVIGWLAAVVRSGAATLEALQAVADVAARAHAAGDEAGLEGVLATLVAALPLDEPDAAAVGDGWSRWLALDIFSRLVGPAAVPVLQAVAQAGGQDDVDWFLPQVRARIDSLGGVAGGASPAGEPLPHVPPLPGLAARVGSRSPRVARRAAHLAAARLAADDAATPAAERDELRAALTARGPVEVALTARGQLLGTFLDVEGVAPAPLGAAWQPWAELLSDADRGDLADAEAAWLSAG